MIVDDRSRRPCMPDVDPGVPVRVLANRAHLGAAASRNAAARSVTADAIAFLDDDAAVFRDWFAVAQGALTRARGAVTGRVLPMDHGSVSRARQARYDARYGRHRPGEPVPFLAGGNSVVWTEAFLAAGGFPDVPTGSDNLLVQALERRGDRCHYEPELRILHRHSKGVGPAFREAFRAGRLKGRDGSGTRRALSEAVRGWREPDPGSGALNAALQLAFETGRACGGAAAPPAAPAPAPEPTAGLTRPVIPTSAVEREGG